MKKILLIVTVLLAHNASGEGVEEAGNEEVLPKAEELRSPYRRLSPYKSVTPSYNEDDAYNSLLRNRKAPASSGSLLEDHYESDYDYNKSKRKGGYELIEEHHQIIPSGSGYGGHFSESGYGKSCVQGYVNASAVALLAFLFLLNIVQDIIQQITQANRRKRDVGEEQSEVMQFINDGGLEALQEGLPRIVIPLLVKMVDIDDKRCLERPLCEANSEISLKYGAVGRVFAYLLSNVVSNAFSQAEAETLTKTLKASSMGRNGESCDSFKLCRQPTRKKTAKEDKVSENEI